MMTATAMNETSSRKEARTMESVLKTRQPLKTASAENPKKAPSIKVMTVPPVRR